MRLNAIVLTLGLAACAGGTSTPDDSETPPASTPPSQTVGCDGTEAVVQFETSDGVTLEADHRTATTANAGAVVLFHMIPPSNDRSGFPDHVRQAFADLGLSVLNVDRRGAGGSGGVAIDAYEGPGALADAEAALTYLMSPDRGCAVDPSRVVLVGASNGSTTTLDYAASHEAGLPDVAGLIFLSPGTYTENQTSISDHSATLEALPIQWLYPTNEPYSDIYAPGPDGWEFIQRGTQHGTQMFDGSDLEADTLVDMTRFLDEYAG